MVKMSSEISDYNHFLVNRKVVHILLGLILLITCYFGLLSNWLLFLLFLDSLIFSAVAFLFKPYIFLLLVKPFIDGKLYRVFGVPTFFFGFFMSFLIFPKSIALASVSILTFGDSLFRLFSYLMGSMSFPWNRLRNFEAFIASVVLTSSFASMFVNPIYAVVASSIAIFLEPFVFKLKSFYIDDNILIPLVSGAILLLMLSFI